MTLRLRQARPRHAKHAHIETFNAEEKALCGEFAHCPQHGGSWMSSPLRSLQSTDAARMLESAITERAVHPNRANSQLVLQAAEMLVSAKVSTVAAAAGVSERHLRRVFREAVGVSPKEFAKLVRFDRAIGAAHEDVRASKTFWRLDPKQGGQGRLPVIGLYSADANDPRCRGPC
jgi:AraC-like DNA-binding protein